MPGSLNYHIHKYCLSQFGELLQLKLNIAKPVLTSAMQSSIKAHRSRLEGRAEQQQPGFRSA